jgi:hypothetical protein
VLVLVVVEQIVAQFRQRVACAMQQVEKFADVADVAAVT